MSASGPNDFLADVLAYIAAHRRPLTLAELATSAGYSPYHFSRLFTARVGTSVISYVRECRLLDAALRLAGDAPPPLIELAFDSGFESQEAFTRAFHRRFGASPGRFRRGAATRHPKETNMTITKTARVEAQQELVRRDAFSVAGVAALFTQDNKSGIPGLWPRLFQKLPLKDQVGQVSYGVCSMIDRDEGSFKYLAGVEVKGETPLPEGFERVTLEPQSYAVYRIVLDGSDLHAQMQAAMPIIWGDMLPKSGRRLAPAPDFEFYPPGFSPNREGAYVDIYVPVEA